MTVWVVMYSNYDPAEVDSIWATKERAEERARILNVESTLPWKAVEWEVDE